MSSMMFRSILAAMLMGLVGCAGESPDRPVMDDEEIAEEDNSSAPKPKDPSCDNNGIQAECDPFDASGCPGTAKCYVIKNIGASCVCPGTIETGEECNTTAECAPTNVCAGTKAPGICTKTCDPDNPDCPAGKKCLFINGLKNFGYCIDE